MAKRKKVPSPTVRPSKVNPDVAAAMAGKAGSRESEYSGKPTIPASDNARARLMDAGRPLSPVKKK